MKFLCVGLLLLCTAPSGNTKAAENRKIGSEIVQISGSGSESGGETSGSASGAAHTGDEARLERELSEAYKDNDYSSDPEYSSSDTEEAKPILDKKAALSKDIIDRKTDVLLKKIDVVGKKLDVAGKKVEIAGNKLELGGKKLDVAGKKVEIAGNKVELEGKKVEDEIKKVIDKELKLDAMGSIPTKKFLREDNREFKFQPDLSNPEEVERFRTSVDEIACDRVVTPLNLGEASSGSQNRDRARILSLTVATSIVTVILS